MFQNITWIVDNFMALIRDIVSMETNAKKNYTLMSSSLSDNDHIIVCVDKNN